MSKEQKTNKKDPTKIVNNFEDTFKLFMFSKDEISKLYRKIKLIRETEFKIAAEREKGNIGGPVHLSIGQEAIATGISLNLNKNDYVFGAHRSHAHIIALGSPITKLFADNWYPSALVIFTKIREAFALSSLAGTVMITAVAPLAPGSKFNIGGTAGDAHDLVSSTVTKYESG